MLTAKNRLLTYRAHIGSITWWCRFFYLIKGIWLILFYCYLINHRSHKISTYSVHSAHRWRQITYIWLSLALYNDVILRMSVRVSLFVLWICDVNKSTRLVCFTKEIPNMVAFSWVIQVTCVTAHTMFQFIHPSILLSLGIYDNFLTHIYPRFNVHTMGQFIHHW